MNDECVSLPGRRVHGDGSRVADSKRVPGCLAVWNRVDELEDMVVVVEDCRVVVTIGLVLLVQDSEESVDVVDRGLLLLKLELAKLERGLVRVWCPIWSQIFRGRGGARWQKNTIFVTRKS